MATGRHLRGVWWIGAAEDTYRQVVQTVVHLCAILWPCASSACFQGRPAQRRAASDRLEQWPGELDALASSSTIASFSSSHRWWCGGRACERRVVRPAGSCDGIVNLPTIHLHEVERGRCVCAGTERTSAATSSIGSVGARVVQMYRVRRQMRQAQHPLQSLP